MPRQSRKNIHKKISDELAAGLFSKFSSALKKHRKHKRSFSDFVDKSGESKAAKRQRAKSEGKSGYQFGDITKSAWKKFSKMFKKADIDKDGKVSQEELDAFKPIMP